MAITEECSELREGVQASPALRQSGRSNTKAMHTSQEKTFKSSRQKGPEPTEMHGLSFFLGDYFWKWSVGQNNCPTHPLACLTLGY